MIDMPIIVRSFYLSTHSELEQSLHHHQDLTVAAQAHDGELARQVMQLHLRMAYHRFMRIATMRKTPRLWASVPNIGTGPIRVETMNAEAVLVCCYRFCLSLCGRPVQAVGTVPPSMTYSVPVMDAARLDTRNPTRSATSLGLAGRPIGIPPSEPISD